MKNQKTILEVAVFSLEAAITAIHAGADRIEFCENPSEGGTTPSYGSLKTLIGLTQKPIFPIIRPRGGDFLYTSSEFECMKADLILAKELGYKGAVIGLLNADGTVDEVRTKELVDIASPMEITFHRAFDRCNNPFEGLEAIIRTGCKRILTSGQISNVIDALPLIKALIQKADKRIIILPGSGVRANNCKQIIEETGAFEIHSSARKSIPSYMQYKSTTMQENMVSIGVDENEVKAMLEALK